MSSLDGCGVFWFGTVLGVFSNGLKISPHTCVFPIKGHNMEDDLEAAEASEAAEANEAAEPADPEEKVKRDVRSVAKFIEVAMVLDKAMFDKRPHSSRKDVIHDAIQVANIADLVSKKYRK